jgi:hypothetical protein
MHEALNRRKTMVGSLAKGYNVLSEHSNRASRLAMDSWACAPPGPSAEVRRGWLGWDIADGHLGRAAM